MPGIEPEPLAQEARVLSLNYSPNPLRSIQGKKNRGKYGYTKLPRSQTSPGFPNISMDGVFSSLFCMVVQLQKPLFFLQLNTLLKYVY